MEKMKKEIIGRVATDDAKWDKCFIDLQSVGVKTNTRFTAYDLPKDAKEKEEYDYYWKAEKLRK
jgi:hypothetical protein